MKIDKRKKKNTTMRIDFMASAKQIAWRKKFAKKYANKGKGKSTKSKKSNSTKPKSKFQQTGKKKDMVAGVDYYKDMRTLLGTAKKPKTKSWKSKK